MEKEFDDSKISEKKGKVKPPKPPAPPPIPPDFYIFVEQGELSGDHDFFRVSVKNELFEVVYRIGSEVIQNGFGGNQRNAVEDFVKRNSSQLLNKIFDVKKGGK